MKITREHVLAEIARLARQLGGRPPGKQMFAQATGIQESLWSGRLWARWSDALAEAGFAPNAMQERFRTEGVLTAILAACRHYEHVPTSAELKLYKVANPTFPSKGAIANHFSTRSALLAALTAKAASDHACKDVAAMVANEPESPAQETTRCLVPRFYGVILSLEWKEAVSDRFVTGAPRPRTPSEQRYSDRSLRSRR